MRFRIFLACLCYSSGSFAEDISKEAWQEGFIGCGVSSPYLQEKLSPDSKPLMKIAGLQAWSVERNGEKQIILTSEDGLTIEGSIFGPEGQDITKALLAMSPMETATALDRPETEKRQN